MPELGEFPEVFPYTDRWLRAEWFGAEPVEFEPALDWTDERLEWNEKLDLTRPRRMRQSDGWVTVRDGSAEGWLLGGCLETICWHLKGSTSWIDPVDAILFLEMSEEAPSPAHVDAYLTDLEGLGVFDAIGGLIIGRPYGYDEDQHETLWRVIRERTTQSRIPVLGNVDIGHTDPMLTSPIGARARIDATGKRFALLEAATAEATP